MTEVQIYQEDLKCVIDNVNLKPLANKSILITGATGLIGSFIVDVLMLYNNLHHSNIKVYAMSRSEKNAERRFKSHIGNPNFCILQHDVAAPLQMDCRFDYIIHAASNAHPQVFSTDPVGTVMGNVFGTYHLLEHARKYGIDRFLFVSSGEVYGVGTDSNQPIKETYCGYIDSTNPRSCYPNAKRTSETLCASYSHQYGIQAVIARPCHVFGPTATQSDSRASTQFILDAVRNKDIILRSQGLQLRSYCYVADCVAGILSILLYGQLSHAYNISNKYSNVTIKELANAIADIVGTKVVYCVENDDRSMNNPITYSVLDSSKLENLGWIPKYQLKDALERTIKILKQIDYQ